VQGVPDNDHYEDTVHYRVSRILTWMRMLHWVSRILTWIRIQCRVPWILSWTRLLSNFVPDNTLYADTVQGAPKTVLDKDTVQCVEDYNLHEATRLGVPDTGIGLYSVRCVSDI
jgi:hypothetical protein